MVRITQVPESPRSLSISVDLNFPLNGVPHWMTETLAGSALMKEASKCSETPNNIDQAMRIPWEKFQTQISSRSP
jgi:hypothetical protein